MHQRTAIRNAIITTLINDVPLVSGRVFGSRVYPMNSEALPGICVYTIVEEAELITTAGFPRSSQRLTNASIQITVKGSDTIDDELDAICSEVETAMANNIMLNTTAADNKYMGLVVTLNGENSDERQGEKTGVAVLEYQILYFVPENNPEF